MVRNRIEFAIQSEIDFYCVWKTCRVPLIRYQTVDRSSRKNWKKSSFNYRVSRHSNRAPLTIHVARSKLLFYDRSLSSTDIWWFVLPLHRTELIKTVLKFAHYGSQRAAAAPAGRFILAFCMQRRSLAIANSVSVEWSTTDQTVYAK